MKLLVIEDDKKISSFIVSGFRQAGYTVDLAGNGEDGLNLIHKDSYDAAVIDIMLPKLDGISVIEEARSLNVKTPVIILSAKRSVGDRVLGLRKGGDDYLVKPFSFSELLARVEAMIRRANNYKISTVQELVVGSLVLDRLKHESTRSGGVIHLRPQEFALLEYMMFNAGRVISKTMILEQLWGYDFNPQTNVVDVLICRLRSKIDKDFDDKMIHTLRGIGYVLKES